jgi:hypothetical protein
MGSTAIIHGVVALAAALVGVFIGFLLGRSKVKQQVEQALDLARTSLDAREFAMRQQVDQAMDEIARLRPLADELGRVQERLKIEQARYQEMKAEFSATFGGNAPESAESDLGAPPQETTPVRESADEQIQRLLKSLEENLSEPEELPLDAAPADQVGIPQSIELQPGAPSATQGQQSAPSIPEIKPSPQPAPEPKPAAPAFAAPKPVASPSVEKQPSVPSKAASKPSAPPLAEPKPATPPVPAAKPVAPPLAEKKPGIPKPADSQSSAVDEWQEFARSLASLTGRKK